MKHRTLRRSNVGLYPHPINYSPCSLPTIFHGNSSNKKAVYRVMSADAECRAVPPLRPVREQDVEILLKYRHCYRHDVQSEPSPRPTLTYVVLNVAAEFILKKRWHLAVRLRNRTLPTKSRKHTRRRSKRWCRHGC
ncbi:uncharacterized protein LOC126273325 [Schistocerca gregaria]|uniref:uncharacterized protein LOC126273325 n=1 Tax=Schistocerca gregaria TaxID=7010 RepID=UPI00211E5575|nr:uncharacterized protein LOC126273325 [Schistocerca gregaria]